MPPIAPGVVLLTAMYPPDPRVGSQRPARIVAHLRERGIAIDVVTCAPGAPSSRVGEHGERIHTVAPDRTVRDRVAVSTDNANHKTDTWTQTRARRSWLRRQLAGWLAFPDLERGSIRPLIRRGRELLHSGPALLYSTAPPHSVHVAAWRLARQSGAPWLAEFRDPWVQREPGTDGYEPLVHFALRRLQRSVLRRAQGFVAVSDGIADWLAGNHVTQPVVVARNGIQALAAPTRTAASASRRVTCTYLGELYIGRDPTPFFASMGRLRDTGTLSADTFRARFVGEVASYQGTPTDRLATTAGVAEMIELGSRVEAAEARRIQAGADVLLLLAQQQPLQVPNKLYDYLGARKPILAYVDDKGESARLLREVGGHFLVTENSTPPEADRQLALAIAAARAGNPVGNPVVLESLSTAVQLRRIDGLVDAELGRIDRHAR